MRASGLAGVDGEPAVVLVNCAGGRELASVCEVLTHLPDTPVVYLDGTDLGATAMTLDVDTGHLDVDGYRIRPTVVWLRHASPCALAARAGASGAMSPLEAEAWSRFLARLAASAVIALPGTGPAGPEQLVAARRLGVRTPRTVVTTDPRPGAHLSDVRRVVVKLQDFRLFEPDRAVWCSYLPAVADRDVRAGGTLTGAGRLPVLVQEHVGHDRELRVHHLDGALPTFEVRKGDPAAAWADPGDVGVTRTACPDAVAQVVRRLCRAWGLRYGAFDVLVDADGEPVLLEANADGDWLWYEHRARSHDITFMAAVMVHELFVRFGSRGARADDRCPA